MKTPTHLAINWLILKRFNVSKKNQIAFLLGGVMPDVAIILTFTFVFLLVHPFSEALATFRALYDHNVWLIGLHSLFHSPLSLAFLFLFAFVIKPYQRRLESFLAGCFCHSLIDIYTHVDDGPLVFWPRKEASYKSSRLSVWIKVPRLTARCET